MANTPDYTVNQEDPRLQAQLKAGETKVAESNKVYDEMISQSDSFFKAQSDAAKQWGETQAKLQNEQTEFSIAQINQQKQQATQDYTKEQNAAYVDWQKQSNQYGANAEQMAAQGMQNTGYSESSQVSMYNTYQSRYTAARESYNRSILNYDNAIKDARLQNNAKLAEIAYQTLQTQLELNLEGFQYKNDLITTKMDKAMEIDQTYYSRWHDALQQINTENELNERVRQFNKEYELEIDKFKEQIREFDEEIARLKDKDAKEYEVQIKELEQRKAEAEEQKRQFEEELAEKKRQFDKSLALKSSGGLGGSGVRRSGGDTVRNDGATSNTTKTYVGVGGGKAGTPTPSSKNQGTVNMNSVLALGQGPISPEYLRAMENAGVVERTTTGNKKTGYTTSFKYTPVARKYK